MQIQHVPPGLGTTLASGLERRPFRPLLGDSIEIRAKVEGAQGTVSARMKWELDGTSMPFISGQLVSGPSAEGQYFSFPLGPFQDLSTVRYQIVAEDESKVATSPSFAFDLLRQGSLGPQQALYQGSSSAYAVFANLTFEFSWERGICVQVLSDDGHVHGDLVDEVRVDLGDGATFRIAKDPGRWALFRNHHQLLAVDFADYTLLSGADGHVYQLECKARTSSQHIFGLGERFDQVDQQRQRVVLSVVEKFTHQGEYSYIPIPFFFTDQGVGWFSSSRRKIVFDAQDHITLTCEMEQSEVLYEERWMLGAPQELLAELHHLTGAAVLPPKWALGIWVSANGWNTQAETLKQLEKMKELQLPATAIVLEAWSDEHTFCIFNDAHYEPLPQDRPYQYGHFTFPSTGKWPDPKGLSKAIGNAGLNLVLWQIPVIKYTEDACAQLRQDEAHAIAHGYCVMNDDGTPYRIPENWFKGSLILDFTNPAAVQWWFGKRAYLVQELGVKGFKTDGGEFLFGESPRLFSGQTGLAAHNAYPMQYVQAYHDFLREHITDGVAFSRAGHSGVQTVPIHWAGDQMSEWSELRSQLTAGISAGLSGILFWSFDMGGFAGDFPSAELYLRSAALAAFSPVMQWHSEPRNGQFFSTVRARWINDRSPWNLASLYDDPTIVDIYRLFANLRINLLPYIYAEAVHSVETARPLLAHLALAYPDDPIAWTVHDQFMFGRDLLVAPVVEKNANGRSIYLPNGTWHDFFTGRTSKGGQVIQYECPLHQIPVFVRDGAWVPANLNQAKIMGSHSLEGGISNKLDSYTQFALLRFGAGSGDFRDDLGNYLEFSNEGIKGRGLQEVFVIDALASGNDAHLFGRGVPALRMKVEEIKCTM